MKKTRLTERFQQLAGIKPLYEIEGLNEDLKGLMAQGEKMAAFANKQSGYEGGISSPVRGVLASMTAAGAPDFDGDEELKTYWTRRLTKAIETQKDRKYMSGFSEEVNEIDESATQYLAIMRDLYPGKSWEELTPDERFKVRSTYEDFN